MNQNKRLEEIYNDIGHPCGFSSITKLSTYLKKQGYAITKKDINEFLKKQDGWTYHGWVPRNFVRKPIKVCAPGHILGLDLADFSSISKYNKKFRYVLVLIDCFSRKLSLKPLKKKTNYATAKAVEDFLKKSEYKYNYIFSDEGGEFVGEYTNKLYKKYGIVRYSVKNRKFKCSIAERVIRTIKEKLYRYFTQNNTLTYIDILNKLQSAYNLSKHKGLGYESPDDVHKTRDLEAIKNQELIQLRQKFRNYGSISKREHQKLISRGCEFEKEAFVRLLLARAEGVFSKSYQKIFTEEIFQIRDVKNSFPVTYYLKDLMGYPIEGVVYERELKAVTPPDHYIIEKVLKTEVDKTTGSRRYLVKWKGYPDHFNSYVDNITKIK